MLFREFFTNLALGQPSAKNKLSFYIRRLGKEAGVRKLAAVMVVLVTLFQTLTFIFPPKPSNAASSNDIIYGGFSRRSQLYDIYNSYTF